MYYVDVWITPDATIGWKLGSHWNVINWHINTLMQLYREGFKHVSHFQTQAYVLWSSEQFECIHGDSHCEAQFTVFHQDFFVFMLHWKLTSKCVQVIRLLHFGSGFPTVSEKCGVLRRITFPKNFGKAFPRRQYPRRNASFSSRAWRLVHWHGLYEWLDRFGVLREAITHAKSEIEPFI